MLCAVRVLNPMAITYHINPGAATSAAEHESHVLHSTQTTLRVAYGAVPIVAGLDKFTNVLTHWEQYLNPLALRVVPVTAEAFMRGVGIIEIVAGVIVLSKPRVGAFIVMLWLLAIAAQLLVGWMYVDVAVRDIMMSLGALTLWRLSMLMHPEPPTT